MSAVFVTLYDEDTLKLYIDRGIYGFLMAPVDGQVKTQSRHYQALADYACMRDSAHVFFFIKRHVVYAGQVKGSSQIGAFLINGHDSPLGREANAPLCWNESQRERYEATEEDGVFIVPDVGRRCQPYLIRFEDSLGLKGNYILSDDLYWRLGDYGYPLPSNAIQDMGFCTLTPRETEIALRLLKEEPRGMYDVQTNDATRIKEPVLPFETRFGITDVAQAFRDKLFVNEAHLEASLLANPDLLPQALRPSPEDTICRQAPISPFKPAQMDRADICYYNSKHPIRNGTIPNVVIELKNRTADNAAVKQVVRYLDWLYRIAGDEAKGIRAFLYAPGFRNNVVLEKYRDQIELISPP